MSELILNPSAATDLTGWTDQSDASLARVTEVAGTTLPSPAATAFAAEQNAGNAYGAVVATDIISLPPGSGAGDTLYYDVWFSPGATAGDCTIQIDIDWYASGTPVTFERVVDTLTTDGWTQYTGSAVAPATADEFDVYVYGERAGAGNVYLTLASAEVYQFTAAGDISLSGDAALTVDSNMAADGTIALAGSAWLSPRNPGQDTFAASGTIRLLGSARLSRDTDVPLPPTDGDGWTAPDVTVPDIRTMKVTLSGIAFEPAQMTDMTIELDVEGGPKSATVSLNCPLDRKPRLGRDTLLVTYKTQVLFRGRLERIDGDVSATTGYDLTYAGPLVALRDHKAYRQVFVDSDLASWRVDQGPQTSPDTFEGITAGLV